MTTIASTDYIQTIEADFKAKMSSQKSFPDRSIFNEAFDPSSKLYSKKASGPFLTSHEGIEYIDLSMGSGSALLGHNPEFVKEAIRDTLDSDQHFIGHPHQSAGKLADLICETIPHFQGVVFSNSGSEATMRAIRLARAYTGKPKFAMFSGGWHGTHDAVLIGEDYDNPDASSPMNLLLSPGITRDIRDNCILLPYNDSAAFDIIEQHRDELSLVLIEPIQGSNPRDDIRSFLEQLRKVTSDNDILLGFDEIITGFRFTPGGMQQRYGIEADVATYGKAIGGGLPVGITAARKEIIQQVEDGVYMGGTFSANPIVTATGLAILRHLLDEQITIYPYLEEQGNVLRNTINEHCCSNNIPVRMSGEQSMSRLLFTDQPVHSRRERDEKELSQDIQKLFYLRLLNLGVITPGNRILFLSTEHNPAIIQVVTTQIIKALDEFQEFNLFDCDPETSSVNANDKRL